MRDVFSPDHIKILEENEDRMDGTWTEWKTEGSKRRDNDCDNCLDTFELHIFSGIINLKRLFYFLDHPSTANPMIKVRRISGWY